MIFPPENKMLVTTIILYLNRGEKKEKKVKHNFFGPWFSRFLWVLSLIIIVFFFFSHNQFFVLLCPLQHLGWVCLVLLSGITQTFITAGSERFDSPMFQFFIDYCCLASKRGTSVNPLGSSNNPPWLYCVAATQFSLDN